MRIQFQGLCNDRRDKLARLRKQVEQLSRSPLTSSDGVRSTGIPSLDRLLPQRGRGSLIEWLGVSGGGAGVLSMLVAQRLCADGGQLVIIDRQLSFYPIGAAAWGVDLNRLIIIRPSDLQEELWAYDQCLRSDAVAATWGFIDRLEGRRFRRLQLAAEAGRGVGLLLRPPQAVKEPTWADVRLQVEPCPSLGGSPHFRVRVLHCRGTHTDGEIQLTLDETTGLLHETTFHDTYPLPLVSELADSTSALRETGT